MMNSVIFEGEVKRVSPIVLVNGDLEVTVLVDEDAVREGQVEIGEYVRAVGRLGSTGTDLFGELCVIAEHIEMAIVAGPSEWREEA